MPDDDDSLLWLEDISSDKALNWVRGVNKITLDKLTSGARFAVDQKRLLELYNSDKKITYVNKQGDYYYNFWRDATHQRGIWRRATWESYLTDDPHWEVILDVDDLAEHESENWVWSGAQFLKHDYSLCLIALSRGGADATVLREFDLSSRQFVENGFQLSEAKSAVSWINQDTLWVGTDFGPDSLTQSGYPRLVKRWHRSTTLDAAELVFEGEPEDMSVSGWCDQTPGFERSFISQNLNFYTSRLYEVLGSEVQLIAKPDDSMVRVYRSWIIIELRSEWRVDDSTYAAGSLLVADYDQFKQGAVEFDLLFAPTSSCFLQSWDCSRDHVVLNLADDVCSRVELRTHSTTGWLQSTLKTPASRFDHVSAWPIEPKQSNSLWLHVSGYLTPNTLTRTDIGETSQTVKSSPEWFDKQGLSVQQHFVNSADGTPVSYFQIGSGSQTSGSTAPTILYGYGGFEISLLPNYSGTIGSAWLEQGGTYVVANIRGGGEYGPAWHQSALKENRARAYEDFIAVGEDLIQRGVTRPQSLGIMGGSNGGLLVGNMYTQRPSLWGAVVCSVPLLDMKRYTKLLAGASWMAEYGDPDNPQEWAYLKNFSPYHNIDKDVDYPPILITTSTRDDRVHPGHARKMAKALMDAGKRVSYYENIEGGHGGSANNEQLAFIKALEFQFLWNALT